MKNEAVSVAKERIAALLSAGYEPFERESGREHYYKNKINYKRCNICGGQSKKHWNGRKEQVGCSGSTT